ncbi:hypothetical protein [Cellulomonas alba]|uniref:Ig-like domain-containing protein n=1 Tax=Cellulomonas alba TaxID=3053467 RepID=A0ABT7SCU9_9CELL|nr:hypothetical protein [Cellulomonas alba]MDM7853879.1 hypothetical protein [Cellulomonas alba]
MSNARTFWSWHRRGLGSALAGAPASGSRAQLPARLALGTAHAADVPVDLLGPGDVSGVEAAQVVRSEPADGASGFPPSELAYLELRDADLPWRFSPLGPTTASLPDPEQTAPAAAQQRVQPWLALVVVTAADAEVSSGSDGLRTLTCDAADLPPSGETWAWAHVQLVGTPAGPTGDALSDPDQAFARLVCPTRLVADQQYVAALVPTFAASLAAVGLPLHPGAGPLDAAWPATGPVTLPAYHVWSFGTGDPGTFETLARRLRPRGAPAAASGVPLRLDGAGWGATAPAGRTVVMQGALRPVGGSHEAPVDATFAASLAHAVSASGTGLELRPPLYGQDYAGGATRVDATGAGWFDQLNTDARRRLAAGLAAWAVAVEQEDLCDRAWQQLADAGVQAPADQVAQTVADALAARHGVGGAAGGGGGGATLAATPATSVAALGASAASLSAAFARITAGRAAAFGRPVETSVGVPAVGVPAVAVSPSAAAAGGGPTIARLLRSGGPLARLGLGTLPAAASRVVTADRAAVEAAGTAAPAVASAGLVAAGLGEAGLVAAGLGEAGLVAAGLGEAGHAAAAPTAAGLPAPPTQRFAPTFPDAGLDALQGTAPEWILPGLDDLPDDSVLLVQTNPAFVEAFLVGLNHALARELQWRRYPLDATATMFRTFWPATTATAPDAIPPVAGWDAASDLGSHTAAGGGDLVLVLRGALLRRFPTATVYLSGQVAGGTEQVVRPTIETYVGKDTTLVGFPMTAGQVLHPATAGQVWSVVLQESVLHTRFGVDDAPDGGGTATLRTWQDLDWGHPQLAGSPVVRVAGPLLGVGRPSGPTTPLGAPPRVVWGADSASVAAALTRAPVRVRIPVSLWLTG